MAVSINTSGTYAVTRIDTADTLTNWAATTLEGAGGGASLLASVGTIDLVAEGTDARASRVNKQRVLIAYTHAAGYDFTTGSTGTGATALPDGNVYIWAAFLAAGSALTKVNGGLQICLGDGTNRSFWNVAGSDTYSGGFVKWAVNTGVTESENDGATADLGDITEVGFVCDVGGTTTRFDNMVVDAMEAGSGLTFQGTTTGDLLFSESQVVDSNTAIGILSESNGIIFSQGSLEFSGTAQTSSAETLVFVDALGGAYTYSFDVTGTVTLTNSTITSSGLADFDFDTSGATAFTMNGGSLGGFSTVTTGSGQTMSGIVFQSGGASSISNTISSSSFNLCDTITVTATGTLSGCTIDNSIGASSVSTTSLAKVTGCSFTSDGSNHAVDLGTVAATTSMDWDNSFSGYAVSDGATGNEVIKVNVASGQTLTINSSSGTPSVYNTGTGTVNVVSGQVTFTLTVTDTSGTPIQGAMVYVTADAGGGLTEGTVIINKVTTDVNGQVSDTRSLGSNQPIVGRARKSTTAPYYKTGAVVGTISSTAGLDLTIQLLSDE